MQTDGFNKLYLWLSTSKLTESTPSKPFTWENVMRQRGGCSHESFVWIVHLQWHLDRDPDCITMLCYDIFKDVYSKINMACPKHVAKWKTPQTHFHRKIEISIHALLMWGVLVCQYKKVTLTIWHWGHFLNLENLNIYKSL